MDIALYLPSKVKIVQEAFFHKRTRDFQVDRPVQAWHWMIQTRSAPDHADWVRPEVSEAWRRCLEEYQLPLGIFAYLDTPRDNEKSSASSEQRASGISRLLTQLSRQFHVFLQEAGVTLVLTDADGVLLQKLGESTFTSPFISAIYEKDSQWSERILGNNGIGSAVHLKKPMAFQGMEHFLSVLHPFSTVGYPLLDDDGELLAVIGLISDRQESLNSLFALLHLLCVLLNTNLPLAENQQAQARVLEKIPFKFSQKPTHADNATVTGELAALLDKAVKLQQYKIPILITGESGVGKDHFVNMLKNAGSRSDKPLIAINCSSIPRDLIESELFGYETGSFTGARNGGKPGKFLLADKGILFLDEIGDMSLDLQSTLLRVLETSEFTPVGGVKPRRVDVQIVAATNVPLQEAVEAGRFRRDLYYRLNGAQIHLPPLREREDKLPLIHRILERELSKLPNAKSINICPKVIALIEQHPWPGNIRQLINVIRTTLYTAETEAITLQDLPPNFIAELTHPMFPNEVNTNLPNGIHNAPPGKTMTLEDWEQYGIKMTLTECDGNISLAARKLGITRTTLYKKINRFGLNRVT
ncbi:sigma-54-dependent Fis family transcriptional regulator [Methylomonas methanica]|uniref:Sigma54 specific transcriptional regulator, Fis family n=1 Tax=Methylomonas methanica (strain DSM 25384 / MC09) TaxID=857087 RepID=G0A1L5_METMM|nr:sigma-54-dependent Fis family transcriptional regulator [Methylomonas methanica]AEG00076.1 sigma54 specific transcriptional regulator, Fis family [Methylomonas methanica MC09]